MPDMTFALPGPIDLVARIGHGALVVHARDDVADASVRLTARDPRSDVVERTVVELRDSTLMVLAPRQGGLADLLGGWRPDRDALDIEIVVPTDTPVRLSSGSADVTVTGRCGAADIARGSGGLTLETVAGNLGVRAGSGANEIGAVRGSVTLRGGSGPTRIRDVGAELQATSGSGNLHVDVVHGAVRARTGSGRVTVGAAYGDVDLAAGSGTIAVGIPAGVSARLDILTGSGRVDTEQPVEAGPRAETKATAVRVRTGSGNVRVTRAGSSGQDAA